MESSNISEREVRRFAHQINFEGIGLAGQEKIKNSRILVVGAGGKGTSAMKSLISAGVGFLGVSDDTLIQEETLSRQSLYNDTDIGKQKAIVSKQYLQNRNKLTQIKVHNIRLTSGNLKKIVELYDLIIDATNNFESHYAICEAAIISNKPLVFGHIENNISFFTTIGINSTTDLKTLLSKDGLFRKEDSDVSSPVILVNSLSGTILANEAISIILEKPSQLESNLLKIKLSNYSFDLAPI